MTGTPNRKTRRAARQKSLIRKRCQGQTRGQVAKALRMVTPRRHRANAMVKAAAESQMRAPLTPAYEVVAVTPSRHEVRLGDQTISWHRTAEKAEEMRARNEAADALALTGAV